MTTNVNKTRDGEIVGKAVARQLIETGDWIATGITQVIDGVSYVRIENDDTQDYCLLRLSESD